MGWLLRAIQQSSEGGATLRGDASTWTRGSANSSIP
uniref:Uncharacterized protein n=1 Tax=Arundo donax TaxID=35708 RepID=A0A0A9HR00_ARUDO